ncbi:MAG TPA: permease, partial [Chloroflexota bacterium]|nr:permease [Chloroflexota bacterium]
ASVWTDVVGGLLMAGALAAWVPDTFWRAFFLTDNPTLAAIEGPLVGPLVAILSFVCSVGNVPLAAVLWQGGISFGGVASFIFADLIVLPILDIYRRYYGGRVALYILATFYVTMAAAGYAVEFLFGVLGIVPTDRAVALIDQAPSWNYTSILNIAFLVLAAVLVWRFARSGGMAMLRIMNVPESAMSSGPGGHETQHLPMADGMSESPHSADHSGHPHHDH